MTAIKSALLRVVLIVLGICTAFNLGRRRGTRSYRLRVAIWAFAIGFAGGGYVFAQGYSAAEMSTHARNTFSANDDTGVSEIDSSVNAEETPEEEVVVSCYCSVAPPHKW